MKTIKYEEIKTPTTVAEFRENLKKYFLTPPTRDNKPTLVVRSNAKQNILVDEISSFSDEKYFLILMLVNSGIRRLLP